MKAISLDSVESKNQVFFTKSLELTMANDNEIIKKIPLYFTKEFQIWYDFETMTKFFHFEEKELNSIAWDNKRINLENNIQLFRNPIFDGLLDNERIINELKAAGYGQED